jgi:hypothetical protein
MSAEPDYFSSNIVLIPEFATMAECVRRVQIAGAVAAVVISPDNEIASKEQEGQRVNGTRTPTEQ